MSEQTFFLYLALGSTFFFIIKIIMLFFIGDSGEDFDSALSDADSQQSFSVFSLQSMLAFLMGSSWVYLAARYEWGYTSGLSLVVGSLFGTLMMLFSSWLMSLTRRLNAVPSTDLKQLVGQSARSYVVIPSKGQGFGQVEIVVAGRLRLLRAINTESKAVASFQQVKVERVEQGVLVIRRLN